MIIPAILEKDFDEVKRKIELLDSVAEKIQVDIIDSTIVEGNTFTDIQKLNKLITKTEITVHLMVKDPLKYIQKPKKFIVFKTTKIAGVSTIITQLINDDNKLKEFINITKKMGYKVGVSINQDQEINLLEKYLKNIDLVQFMGVIPGKQGGELIPSVLDKIAKFKSSFPIITTQIDGGVNDYNFHDILKTGVDNVVIGSAIFNTENPKQRFMEFSNLFNERKTAHGRDGYN